MYDFFKGGSLNKLKQTPAQVCRPSLSTLRRKQKIVGASKTHWGCGVDFSVCLSKSHIINGNLRGPTPQGRLFTQEIRPLWRDYEPAWWIWALLRPNFPGIGRFSRFPWQNHQRPSKSRVSRPWGNGRCLPTSSITALPLVHVTRWGISLEMWYFGWGDLWELAIR